jgi:uncharacterized protein (TIGR03000 family)
MFHYQRCGWTLLAGLVTFAGLPAGNALAQTPGTAFVRVLLPPGADNATVMFGAQVTKEQTGRDRWYVTPQLEPGKKFYYDVTVTWMADNKEMKQTRKVYVNPGKTAEVDFTKEDGAKKDDPAKDDTKKNDAIRDDNKKTDDQKKQQTFVSNLTALACCFSGSSINPLWVSTAVRLVEETWIAGLKEECP